MSDAFESLPLSGLLERAGFHVRGRRADCIHCEGRSRLTVAFDDEVYYCHRCKLTGNVRTLARGLGMQPAPYTREQREKRQRATEFNEWRDTCHKIIVRRLRYLTRRAELAKTVLARFPDCEPAWNALADLHHNEAILLAALDTLSFEKVSPWLETPMTKQNLVSAFAEASRRAEIGVPDAA